MWKIPIVLTTLWKISKDAFHIVDTISVFSQNYLIFFTVAIRIVNNLEHSFHISSIQPTDLLVLPQILPQSAKFLPRARACSCSRRSRDIPSLDLSLWMQANKRLKLSYETRVFLNWGLTQKTKTFSILFAELCMYWTGLSCKQWSSAIGATRLVFVNIEYYFDNIFANTG